MGGRVDEMFTSGRVASEAPQLNFPKLEYTTRFLAWFASRSGGFDKCTCYKETPLLLFVV